MTNEKTICLKCAHSIDLHNIMIIGNYDYMEISCKGSGEDYNVECNCDAGFGKVQIKKEFTLMRDK